MRGISNKNRLKAEMVAAARIAFMEAIGFGGPTSWPTVYLRFGPTKTPQVWRLSDDIVDAYEGYGDVV